MEDILTRLREDIDYKSPLASLYMKEVLLVDAADEIERLRGIIREWEEAAVSIARKFSSANPKMKESIDG